MPSRPSHPLHAAIDAIRRGTPGRADHLLDTAARTRALDPPTDAMVEAAWELLEPGASSTAVARWLRWMELAGVDPARVRDRLGGPVASVPLGSFILESPIGTGASGEVFRARHVLGGFAVAIKRLARLTPIQSLEREAEAIAALDHPAVVRLLDVGTVGPVAAAAHGGLAARQGWVALELVDGADLQSWLAGADAPVLDTDAVLDLLERLASGLAHAHARDVLHLDVKPANVLVGKALDEAKLCDFGLATLAEDERRRRAAGSPSFMAPEQCRADWRAFGPHTDVYGLGCLTVWLLEGRPLYAGSSIHSILDLQVNGPVPELSPRQPIPDGLRTWVRRCLAKRPVDRFRTAVHALQALRGLRDAPESSAIRPRADGLRGRSEARSALWDAFSRCVATESTERVLLRGEPGLGRTTLMRWLQHAVREHSGVRALHFDGALGGRAAFRQTFGRALKTAGLSGRACVQQVRNASGVVTGVVAELMSEALVDGPVRGAGLELLRAWLSEGPVVLLFDDSDASWLHWLGAQKLDGSLLLVASLPEDGSRGRGGSTLLAAGWTTIELHPLPDRVMAWLLHDEHGLEAALADQLAPRLGGNPAWAREVVSRWADAGWLEGSPEGRVLRSSLDDAFSAMADVEPAWTAVVGDVAARRAFEVFAQLGLRVDRSVLEAVWGALGLEVPEEALRRAEDAGRIREVGGVLGFVRPWEREQLRAVVDDPAVLQHIHEVCAEELESRDRLGDAGRQWLAAGRPERAIPAILSSALHHARVGEPALALAELAALEGWDLDQEATWSALLARSMVADAYWRREEAVELATGAQGDPRPERRVEALLVTSRNLSPQGRHAEAVEATTRAVEIAERTEGFDDELKGRAMWNLAFALKYAGQPEEFQRWIARARELWARSSGPQGRARTVKARAAEAVGTGRMADAAEAYEQAAELYLELGARREAVRALHLASAARRWNDEPHLAWPLELSGLAIADTDLADRYRSSLVSLAVASGDRGRARRELSTWALLPGRAKLSGEAAYQALMRVSIDAGDLDGTALDELLERIDEGDEAGLVHPAELGWHLGVGAVAARDAGRLDRARVLAERSRAGWLRQGVDRAPRID